MTAHRSSSKPASHARPARDADLESFRDISDDVIESDFVPFACLYDQQTIATKNGELLQTLKITGLGFEAHNQRNLRQTIRDAIRQCIPDESFAIWMHTLRRRQQLVATSHFPDKFSAGVDAAWRETHPASASFVNELYITIVKAGQSAALNNLDALRQSLWPPRDALARSQYLQFSLEQLTQVTDRMLQHLQPYGARRLQVVEREGMFYAEPLEFLEKLINLEQRPMPVPMRDLSLVLTSGDITFGHNSMEVRTAEGKRRFGTMMTVKEYKESTLAGIDKFLDIPCELIVTQCFDFIGAEKAREAYETQARYLSISGDRELAEWMEIDRLTQNGGQRTYGEQQTTIFLIAPSVKQLEQNVRLTQRALSKLGMVAIREDLRSEECYWAQLPGNFPFISRKQSVDTEHLAGFATVQTQPMGNASGSPWGPPVSLLTTIHDAPFFFNFHRDASAHTIVLGKPKTGRSSITHFLLAQARRLPLNLWYLDVHGRGAPFMNAMGARTLEPGTPALRLNPFQLPDNPANNEFLAVWLSTLIDPEGRQLNRASLDFFQQLVASVMQLPREQRRLSALLPYARQADPLLAAKLQRFCAGGEFGELLDMPDDNFAVAPLLHFSLGKYAHDIATRVPLASYLLHRLTMQLHGEATMLVLDEGFDLLASPLFGARAAQWLDYLTHQNAAALIMSEKIEASGNYAFAPHIAARAASIFAMPDSHPCAEYAMGFGLTETDMAAIGHMVVGARHVFLKRGEQSTLLKMDLANLGPLLQTLHGRAAAAPQRSAAELLNELMGFGAGASA